MHVANKLYTILEIDSMNSLFDGKKDKNTGIFRDFILLWYCNIFEFRHFK